MENQDVDLAATGEGGGVSGFFGMDARGTNFRTEVIAGVTTFVTMAYILFVNAQILADAGMNQQAALMATALAAGAGSLLIGLLANVPFGLAPGMGLNAYFTYSVVIGQGLEWETVLGAVFIDGVIFLVLSLLPVRERIIQEIPHNLKLAISGAIGLFIAFIGLQQMGIVVSDPDTFLTLGNVTTPGTVLGLAALVIIGILMAMNIRGAILWGILAATVVAFFVPSAGGGTISQAPESLSGILQMPDFVLFGETFLQLDILGALEMGVLMVIFTFTFVDMFDTAGTLTGLATKLGIIDDKGSFPKAGESLVSDSLATMAGALFGTSTTTTYIESAAGVSEGGRTGLTAVVVGLLFLLSLFFWPLAGVIPPEATAPALVIVGFLMAEPLLDLDLGDVTEGLPAFATLILMPLTFSIANGLVFGILLYTLLKIFTGRVKELSVTMWILSGLFVVYLLYGAAQLA